MIYIYYTYKWKENITRTRQQQYIFFFKYKFFTTVNAGKSKIESLYRQQVTSFQVTKPVHFLCISQAICMHITVFPENDHNYLLNANKYIL